MAYPISTNPKWRCHCGKTVFFLSSGETVGRTNKTVDFTTKWRFRQQPNWNKKNQQTTWGYPFECSGIVRTSTGNIPRRKHSWGLQQLHLRFRGKKALRSLSSGEFLSYWSRDFQVLFLRSACGKILWGKKKCVGTGSNSTCFCGFHLGVSKLRAMWTLIHNPLEQRVPFSEKLICWCFLFAADNILSCQKYPTCYTHCIRNHRIHTVPIASPKIWNI